MNVSGLQNESQGGNFKLLGPPVEERVAKCLGLEMGKDLNVPLSSLAFLG